MSDIEDLQVYEGTEPYIFLSYLHERKELMLKLFNQLTSSGYRVWFDNGIHTGTDWQDVLAQKTSECTHFIAIVTQGYFDSFFCNREMDAAVDLYKEAYESTTDKSNFCPPITLLLGDGFTIDTIPRKNYFTLNSVQHCCFNAEETFDKNSMTFKKILEIKNLSKCKIDSAQLSVQKASEANFPTHERAKMRILDKNLPEMTPYMVSSALADRIHNAALMFSNADEKAGFDLYKAAFRSRKSLVDQEPDNEKENTKLSDLCSDIEDFACGHNIDVNEIFGA